MRKIFEAGLSYEGKIFKTFYLHPTILQSVKENDLAGLLTYEDACPIMRIISPSEQFENLGTEKRNSTELQLANFIVELIGETISKTEFNKSDISSGKTAKIEIPLIGS